MNRTEWLGDADVAGFARYLADVVHGAPGSFVQRYRPRKAGERHREVELSCFADAVTSYSWAGRNLVETTAHLARTSEGLREAVRGDDVGETLARCIDIVAWGGVSNDATAKCLVRRHDTGALPRDIASATRALLSDDDADAQSFRDNVLLRSDSAMTKVHAANDPRVLVYDDRVGAALGRLAREYLTLAGRSRTPATLAFMRGTERRRDPSCGPLRFARKRTGAAHALWNQRAGWLVADVVADARGALPAGTEALAGAVHPHRVVEAGLFMIGYDVTNIDSIDVPLATCGEAA